MSRSVRVCVFVLRVSRQLVDRIERNNCQMNSLMVSLDSIEEYWIVQLVPEIGVEPIDHFENHWEQTNVKRTIHIAYLTI